MLTGEAVTPRVPVNADTITEAQINFVRRAMIGQPRKTSYHRAILQDCNAALEGSRPCRESVAAAYNKILGDSPPAGTLTAETVTDAQIAELLDTFLSSAVAHIHRQGDMRLCRIALGHIRKSKAERAAAREHCAEILNENARAAGGVTADTITEAQINEVRTWLGSETYQGATDDALDCHIALVAPLGSIRRIQARARCAEILNARAKG